MHSLALLLLLPLTSALAPSLLLSNRHLTTRELVPVPCSEVNQKDCGSSCIPMTYTCCPDNSGGCPLAAVCTLGDNGQYGCCPIGENCGGPGGTETNTIIGPGGTETTSIIGPNGPGTSETTFTAPGTTSTQEPPVTTEAPTSVTDISTVPTDTETEAPSPTTTEEPPATTEAPTGTGSIGTVTTGPPSTSSTGFPVFPGGAMAAYGGADGLMKVIGAAVGVALLM